MDSGGNRSWRGPYDWYRRLGANNIYSVRLSDGSILEHVRLKGKKLRGAEGEHNPLAPGDQVCLDTSGETAQIASREERTNTVVRWNRTRHRMQAVAANTDRICIVAATTSPDYRAAFIDRVLVMAEQERIPVVVVANKLIFPYRHTPPNTLPSWSVSATRCVTPAPPTPMTVGYGVEGAVGGGNDRLFWAIGGG